MQPNPSHHSSLILVRGVNNHMYSLSLNKVAKINIQYNQKLIFKVEKSSRNSEEREDSEVGSLTASITPWLGKSIHKNVI